MTGTDSLRGVLTDWLLADKAALLCGETVGRGANPGEATVGLLDRFGEAQVVDLPAVDDVILGFAVGAALAGRPTVVQLVGTSALHAAAPYLTDLARAGTHAAFVARVPSGPHADDSLLPVLDTGADVFVAGSPDRVAHLWARALSSGRPTLIVEPRSVMAAFAAELQVAPTSPAVLLAAFGDGVALATTAARRLNAEGIPAEVFVIESLVPLDTDLLGAALAPVGRLVVVHPNDETVAQRIVLGALSVAFEFLEAPIALASSSDEAVRAAHNAFTW